MTTALAEIRPIRGEDALELARLEALVESSPWSEQNFSIPLTPDILDSSLKRKDKLPPGPSS